jgi:hypothetical protein
MRIKLTKRVWLCVFALTVGCVSIGCGGSVETTPASGPEPGTQVYYEQRIVGKYVLDGEGLLAIRGADGPGVVDTGTTAEWLEGPLLEIRDGNLLVVGRAVTSASGAVRTERGFVLAPLPDRPARAINTWLRMLAVRTQ